MRIDISSLTTLGAMLVSGMAFAADPAPLVSGGVGAESQQQILQMQDAYSLKLVFSDEEGLYLADVVVSIRDGQGQEVVKATSDGPILLAELAPGRYTITASAEGHSKVSAVVIGHALSTHHIQISLQEDDGLSSAGRAPLDRTAAHFPG